MRKGVKFAIWLLLLLPLGFLGVIVLTMAAAHTLAARIDPEWKPSTRVLMWARLWTAFYRDVPLPFLLAILHNEGASTPRPLTPAESLALNVDTGTVAYPPGDLYISHGPSLGCGQVLRTNVEALWSNTALTRVEFPLPASGLKISVRRLVVFDSPYALAQVGNERGAVWACVAMLRQCIADAAGDVYEAARRYNGGAKDDTKSEEDYAQRVVDTLERIA